jgi:endonuclease/exonuclease/phosphatase family metal-dependent hydrolase
MRRLAVIPILAPLVALLVAMAPPPPPGAPGPGRSAAPRPTEPAGAFTVMSFNLRYGVPGETGKNSWAARMPVLIELLRTHAPDVVGTQEARAFQIDLIKAQLPEYAEVGFGYRPRVDRAHRVAILYRRDRFEEVRTGVFWFSDTPRVRRSATWGNVTPRQCNWAQLVDRRTHRAFFVFNLHLEPGQPRHQTLSVELLAHRIAQRLPARVPVIVTGDFNLPPAAPAMRFLAGEQRRAGDVAGPPPPPMRLVDGFRAAHPEPGPNEGTFHAFGGAPNGPRIDYVLVDPALEVRGAKIIRDNANRQYPSDHFPVMVGVGFR